MLTPAHKHRVCGSLWLTAAIARGQLEDQPRETRQDTTACVDSSETPRAWSAFVPSAPSMSIFSI